MHARSIGPAFAVLVIALLLAGGAGAAARPSLRVQPTVVHPGGAVTVLGEGWKAGSKIVLAVGPVASEADPVATLTANTLGRFKKTLRFHAEAKPGTYAFLACQRACAVKASARFRIVR